MKTATGYRVSHPTLPLSLSVSRRSLLTASAAEYPPAYPWEGTSSLAGCSTGRNHRQTMQEQDKEIRCGQCHKLLARGWARDAHIVHKCPRCGAYNTLRAIPPKATEPARTG